MSLIKVFTRQLSSGIAGVLLLLLCLPAHALEASDQTLKIALTYNFFKYVQWPQEKALTTFRVGVIGVDDDFYEEMAKAAPLLQIRGKGFTVTRLSTDSEAALAGFQLLYIGAGEFNNIAGIAQRTRGKGTLLVSESSRTSREIMINLYRAPDNTLKFQINRSNLVHERLNVDKQIVMLGGSELDVANLFRESEDALQQIKTQLAGKEKQFNELLNEISKQQGELKNNQQRLNEQKALVEAQKSQMADLAKAQAGVTLELTKRGDQLKKSQLELESSYQQLEAGQKQLATSSAELKANESQLEDSRRQLATNMMQLQQGKATISSLTKEIDNREKVLDKQRLELQEQIGIIDNQRFWIATITVIALCTLGLAIAIFRVERARKKVVQKLNEANSQLKTIHDKLERDRREADRANKEKSRFLANMSHEIRTPMNVILGYSELLQQAPGLGNEGKRNLQVINRSGEHLLKLINDVLDISKIESGNISITSEHFSLQSLLVDIDVMFRPRCEQNQLQLQINTPPDTQPCLYGDRGKLLQILINLIGNAIKFTHVGHIHVHAGTAPRADGKVLLTITVEDTGEGIGEKDFDKVFRLYEQTESGLHSGKGTGLGLAISREFARKMGGDLSFTSSAGTGSTFLLSLPFLIGDSSLVGENDPTHSPIALRAGQSSRRILVVDDNTNNRDLLKKILLPFGFELKEAASGHEAISACDAWEPHLVLMDLRMPEMNGREAIRQIRTRHAQAQLAIIVVTASAIESERQAVLELGINDYVRKPFRASELLSKIGDCLTLEYVYSDLPRLSSLSEQALSNPTLRQAVAALPAEVKRQLQDAVTLGHATRLLQLIDELAASQAPLAAAMRALAFDFDYDALGKILAPDYAV